MGKNEFVSGPWIELKPGQKHIVITPESLPKTAIVNLSFTPTVGAELGSDSPDWFAGLVQVNIIVEPVDSNPIQKSYYLDIKGGFESSKTIQ